MEQRIVELIEDEVERRVGLRISKVLEHVSGTYDIPLEQLIRDSSKIEFCFCKGVLKTKQRCLKKPQQNGYCKFHQNQVPVTVAQPIQRVDAPWELT